VTEEQARVLARDGNVAVTQLAGRAFPGIHIQGDTFAELQRQFADAVSQLGHTRDDTDAWEELDSAVDELSRPMPCLAAVGWLVRARSAQMSAHLPRSWGDVG
jgi:hypothetical protein